jgi:hypothetical protein
MQIVMFASAGGSQDSAGCFVEYPKADDTMNDIHRLVNRFLVESFIDGRIRESPNDYNNHHANSTKGAKHPRD